VSLSLSEEVARMQSSSGPTKADLSVETCLERFVMPEKLGDSVSCPSCARKTCTQKQHTFGTLPKVLCLHLKRFDAALNKKIDDFVSFPASGLNMGKYLAQWCEVSSLRSSDGGGIAEPQVYYDLFGTVNHVGNMQSGHYVTNVKVDDRWYNFNDAHVSLAGGDGSEKSVVKNAGAYILFYVRREDRGLPSTW
jgi:ubiquitin C-terminal hydrolase